MPAPLPTLRLVPLGGLGEIGMNCLALEQRGEALVVDCGVSFEGRELGVDVVHPDLSALEAVHVSGLFVTHGHEDHIGAIPYFLKRFDVPVFGPRYALQLLRERAAEHDVLKHADLREAQPRSRLRVGSFEVEPLRVTHSIADATALAVRTDAGLVVHTGDFKFDDSPPDGETFDVERFAELSREGVRLLLSDSTNIDARGSTGSEAGVGQALDAIVGAATGAVVVGIFASNVHRLRMLGEIAQKHGRKIVPLGRSVETHARVARAVARATGPDAGAPYLQWPSDLLWPADRARELPRRAVLAVATGTQGEAGAALARLARGEQTGLEVGAGDLVVLSSRVIPGNERDVMGVVSALLRRGVELRSWWSDRAVHVSGHAHRDEQQRMIELVQPRAFVPLHGTLHHLTRHAGLARELGVPEVAVLEDGDVGELGPSPEEALRKAGRVAAGRVHVFAQRAVAAKVLQERSSLAARGAAHVVVAVDPSGCLVGDLQLSTQGVFDPELDSHILYRAREEARAALQELATRGGGEASADGAIADAVRLAIRRAIERALGFKPSTLVTVVRIAR
jgi:ribonuclease J